MIRMKTTFAMFDRQIVKYNWNRINRTPLTRSGLLVRKIARTSIRRRPYKYTSPAGGPPYSHVEGVNPPFKMIYSVPDMFYTRVTVGMVGFGTKLVPVPGMHEHGEAAMRMVRTERGQKLWELLQANRAARKGQPGKPISSRRKAAIKRILAPKPKLIRYRERPFMAPALRIARPRISSFWFMCFNNRTVFSRVKAARHVYGPTQFVGKKMF